MTTQPDTTPDVKYVSFSAGINQQTVDGLIRLMAGYHNQGVPKVYITLSTSGGEVDAGVHLYNYLKGLPFELTIHNVGFVNSVGIIVFLAGDKRYANAHSTFMFHGVGFSASQGQRFEEQQLRDRLNMVLRQQERLGSIIQEHTNLDGKAMKGLFSKAETKDAEWAEQHGFINEIRDLRIPSGTPIDSLMQGKST